MILDEALKPISHNLDSVKDGECYVDAEGVPTCRWGAVILDEAHERKKEADQLLVLMAAACKVRPKFKVVVMSATIEPSFYVNMIKGNGVPGNCPALDVEGVTFPVKDVWWEGEAWDPQADTALMDLALECSRVYLQSKTGHVLVFVSTVGQVKQMVKDVTATMAHDKSCIVLGLYGAMSGSERAEVSDFSTMPKNKGKRMICISTNVAEAGVTIAGMDIRSAVTVCVQSKVHITSSVHSTFAISLKHLVANAFCALQLAVMLLSCLCTYTCQSTLVAAMLKFFVYNMYWLHELGLSQLVPWPNPFVITDIHEHVRAQWKSQPLHLLLCQPDNISHAAATNCVSHSASKSGL